MGLSARAAAAAMGLSVLRQAAAQTAGVTVDTFNEVGNMGVSAQQLFLDQYNNVIVVDKTEANGNQNFTVDGHPAWGSRWNITSNTAEPMDLVSNSFCAGGNVMADGTWLNVGGNQAVTYGGLSLSGNGNPYGDADGGKAIRVFKPCDTSKGQTCEWDDTVDGMTTRRWYPTLETLEDGNIIIIGGCDWGGYVNDAGQNNPTIEYYPSQGSPIGLNLLTTTLPANLFALTWLLPSGMLFINANLGTELFDYKTNTEYQLDDVPHSVRTYPGSAATAMMPLTPANNWTATLWFCGGTDLQPDQWSLDWNIAAYPADDTCVSMTPDVNTTWVDEESLPEGRVMGNMIALPDGRFIILNGIGKGTAGYGNTSWAVGQAFGTDPVYQPLYFDPELPSGSRFYRDNMQESQIPRLYHSSATLLPDGSVLTSGSNPNADYIAPGTPGYQWPTEYRVEYYYPDYYNERRPQPQGMPSSITYGGDFFNLTLSQQDVGDDSSVLSNTKVVLIRPGFSTHAINFGQRYVQLNSTATFDESAGTATLHVSPLPPNAAILAPGPALMFVVVDGVPSIGEWVTVGNSVVGKQPTAAVADLPASSGFEAKQVSASSGSTPAKNNKDKDSSASSLATSLASSLLVVSAALAALA